MKILNIREFSLTKPKNEKVKIGYLVQNVELIDKNLNFINLYSLKGKKIISCFPSIDTGICDTQTKSLYELIKEKQISLINVSVDLPFALGRWCISNELPNINLYSDYLGMNLGHELGIIIDNANLLYRSLFILDENNKIVYFQLADKVSSALNFDEIKNFLKNF
ncbi:redoxin family protein [Mycoplasmoides alvi]|uniref:redoxin family protein n=1 Tax=Mycoplasmoides alvi TaxID=78580 RepID=UPI000697E907|nr:redoxin family protein [Mycoplasmoides alvi]